MASIASSQSATATDRNPSVSMQPVTVEQAFLPAITAFLRAFFRRCRHQCRHGRLERPLHGWRHRLGEHSDRNRFEMFPGYSRQLTTPRVDENHREGRLQPSERSILAKAKLSLRSSRSRHIPKNSDRAKSAGVALGDNTVNAISAGPTST